MHRRSLGFLIAVLALLCVLGGKQAAATLIMIGDYTFDDSAFVDTVISTFGPISFNGTDLVSSIAVAVGMIVNVLLMWLLLPANRLGLLGAAVAMTGSNLVSSAILGVSFSRISGIGPLRMWRFRWGDWAIFDQAKNRFFGLLGGGDKMRGELEEETTP